MDSILNVSIDLKNVEDNALRSDPPPGSFEYELGCFVRNITRSANGYLQSHLSFFKAFNEEKAH